MYVLRRAQPRWTLVPVAVVVDSSRVRDRAPVGGDGGLVLSRHAPRTRGDVVVFHRAAGMAMPRSSRAGRSSPRRRARRACRTRRRWRRRCDRGLARSERRDETRRERASSVRTEGKGKGARTRKRRRFHTHSRTTSRQTKGARATDDDELDELDELDEFDATDARTIAPARTTRSLERRARSTDALAPRACVPITPITVTTHRTPISTWTRIHAHRVVLRHLDRVTMGEKKSKLSWPSGKASPS